MLILENGAYGKRQAKICQILGINHFLASFPEDKVITKEDTKQLLEEHGSFSMVSLVHCETSSGVFNQVEEIGELLNSWNPGKFVLHKIRVAH